MQRPGSLGRTVRPRVLSVAGSDPSGGAGIQADLKTFAAFRCHGMAVVTALTAQDTTGVRGVHAPPASFVADCLDAVLSDCPPAATKTGMLFDAAIVRAVAARLRRGGAGPVVVDPVMVATSGDRLLREDAVAAVREDLFPLAAVVTPNVPEAEWLAGRRIRDEPDAIAAARDILALGSAAVLLKGGHLAGARVVDVLVGREGVLGRWERPRIPGGPFHGAGCTLSAALAASLARGLPLVDAAAAAGEYVRRALAAAAPQGRGAVPLDHLVAAPDVDA